MSPENSENSDPNAPKPLPELSGGPPYPPKITARDLEDPSPEDSVLDEIARRMARFPSAQVNRARHSIAYLPDHEDGFKVKLSVQPNFRGVEVSEIYREGSDLKVRRVFKKPREVYFVSYGNCVGKFFDREQAVAQFGFGLCTECRVRESLRGQRPFRQIAETWDEEGKEWRVDSTATRWIFWPNVVRFPSRECYLQNRLIDFASPAMPWAA